MHLALTRFRTRVIMISCKMVQSICFVAVYCTLSNCMGVRFAGGEGERKCTLRSEFKIIFNFNLQWENAPFASPPPPQRTLMSVTNTFKNNFNHFFLFFFALEALTDCKNCFVLSLFRFSQQYQPPYDAWCCRPELSVLTTCVFCGLLLM